jgi:hypothetical protein
MHSELKHAAVLLQGKGLVGIEGGDGAQVILRPIHLRKAPRVWHTGPINLTLIAREEIHLHESEPVTELNGLRVGVSNGRKAINVAICHAKNIGGLLAHGVTIVLSIRDALGSLTVNHRSIREAQLPGRP